MENEHGTITGYLSRKCRCDECKRAYADYRREYRMGRRIQIDKPLPPIKHGTLNGYGRRKCRCDECLTVGRAYHNNRQRSFKSTGVRPGPQLKPVAEHGTIARYNGREKCRCDKCRVAAAKYRVDLRANRHVAGCVVDGCDNELLSLGLCIMHYQRWKKNGDPGQTKRKIRAPGDGSVVNGYRITAGVPDHRRIMAEYIGRPLLKHESVHHVNGVRDDNRIENLELWSKSQPAGQRVVDKIAWAEEILATYADVRQLGLF